MTPQSDLESSKNHILVKQFIYYQALDLPITVLSKIERRTKEAKYPRMDQVKFVEDSLQKTLLGPFLDNLPQKILGKIYLPIL